MERSSTTEERGLKLLSEMQFRDLRFEEKSGAELRSCGDDDER